MAELGQRKIESQISNDDQGKRLDLWLSTRFTYRSRNQWQELVKDGTILLNGNKTRPSRKLQKGDIVTFIPPTEEEPEVEFNYDVIFEDTYFMVINKPGNLPCHPAGRFYRHTLWYDLSIKMGDVFIVNRLDRETSGLVLVGKSAKNAGILSKLFSQGTIEKKYYLLVHGQFPEQLIAKGYLQPDSESEVRKKRCFTPVQQGNHTAEAAETHFKCLRSNGKFSLVEATPKTGRLHQIRATSCSLGFPLVGDKLYGIDDQLYLKFIENSLTDTDYKELILSHQALHAYFLHFFHPFTNQVITAEAPLPDDFRELLSRETVLLV